tara:strand:- start:7 stop:423 length:417 start_codon:yes stop_codon:yes gene_type:complete
MTKGFLYCVANKSMPGILKIGVTENTPEEMISKANEYHEWSPALPYFCLFAKKVNSCENKLETLYTLLESHQTNSSLKKGFYELDKKMILNFFNLMDGKMWENKDLEDEEKDDLEEDDEDEEEGDEEEEEEEEEEEDD